MRPVGVRCTLLIQISDQCQAKGPPSPANVFLSEPEVGLLGADENDLLGVIYLFQFWPNFFQ
jgi:hypothetical protein